MMLGVNLKPYIDKAFREQVEGKTLKQVQYETALTWCARACVAAKLELTKDAEEYAHEAIEHAALADGNGELLREVRKALRSCGVPMP